MRYVHLVHQAHSCLLLWVARVRTHLNETAANVHYACGGGESFRKALLLASRARGKGCCECGGGSGGA